MKRFDELITTQKTSALCNLPFLKKNLEKLQKIVILEKNVFFCGVSKNILEMRLCREMMFFALQSVHQNTSFKLSNDSLGQFHFLPYNGGSIFGKVAIHAQDTYILLGILTYF